MTPVSRFRLFGRPATLPAADAPPPDPADPRPWGVELVGAAPPWRPGPAATRGQPVAAPTTSARPWSFGEPDDVLAAPPAGGDVRPGLPAWWARGGPRPGRQADAGPGAAPRRGAAPTSTVGAGVAWPAPAPASGPTAVWAPAAPVPVGTRWPRSDTDAVGDAGPATRAARPAVGAATGPPDAFGAAVPTRSAHPGRRFPDDDPPTDPHGFPPVPAAAMPPTTGTPATGARDTAARLTASPGIASPGTASPDGASPDGAVDPAEAAALAAAFAVDYLSWDEDDPDRRGRVLLDYLPGRDPAHLGWSGVGRQRAEFALPGRVRPTGGGRLLVDVRTRVTPYCAVGEHGPVLDPVVPGSPASTCVPAAAPAPTGRGWRSLASVWVRLSVPIVQDGHRVVVDAWEEPSHDAVVDADDDPAAEPAGGPDAGAPA